MGLCYWELLDYWHIFSVINTELVCDAIFLRKAFALPDDFSLSREEGLMSADVFFGTWHLLEVEFAGVNWFAIFLGWFYATAWNNVWIVIVWAQVCTFSRRNTGLLVKIKRAFGILWAFSRNQRFALIRIRASLTWQKHASIIPSSVRKKVIYTVFTIIVAA